jgi:hypothetical protein
MPLIATDYVADDRSGLNLTESNHQPSLFIA